MMQGRILILHCGPMKTGSTALQDLLMEQRNALLKLGISYYHVRAKTLQQQLSNVLDQESKSKNRVILLSSEFFAQVDPASLLPILSKYDTYEKHAVFCARPLIDLYPSLYLQNLKGSSMRTTSFKEFLDIQLLSDEYPADRRAGQVLNFKYLDERLSGLGFSTHWMMYSRRALVSDFLSLLAGLSGTSLQALDRGPLRPAAGVSPRRSLRMEFSGIARLLNYLTKRSFVTRRQREVLLIALLNSSELLNFIMPKKYFIANNLLIRCALLDRKINHQFLMDRNLSHYDF